MQQLKDLLGAGSWLGSQLLGQFPEPVNTQMVVEELAVEELTVEVVVVVEELAVAAVVVVVKVV